MEAAGGKAEGALAAPHIQTQFERVRRTTSELCAPLSPEDQQPQSMADCSPTKWHLAHTTWFFDVFVLEPFEPKYTQWQDSYRVLFNSYYQQVGRRQLRPERGLLTRPSLQEVLAYRRQVEERVSTLLRTEGAQQGELLARVELGCHHEQQHQELILTDIKHLFSKNLTAPAYIERDAAVGQATAAPALSFSTVHGDVFSVGHDAESFCFDNETPRHQTLLQPFQIASRLVTNAEYLEFIDDGGYQRPELWLDAGFAWAQRHGWERPLYWQECEGRYQHFTLNGLTELNGASPVCHVSYYEADAFARWAGARLPREHEWEVVAARVPVAGNLLGGRRFAPTTAPNGELVQLFGDTWEWTSSSYDGYPGYQAADGALGEYNGKFMCNQRVLRGGSCVTDASHIRPTYRNFFHPQDRWQFSGIRLAKDAS